MKKKSINLSLNKLTISKLDNLKGIKGGTMINQGHHIQFNPNFILHITAICNSDTCNTIQATDVEPRSSDGC